jgi:hypothetical protein
MLAFSETILREKIRDGVANLNSPRRGLFWTLTLEMTTAYRKAYIEWCDSSMRLLEESFLGEVSAPLDGAGATAEQTRAG